MDAAQGGENPASRCAPFLSVWGRAKEPRAGTSSTGTTRPWSSLRTSATSAAVRSSALPTVSRPSEIRYHGAASSPHGPHRREGRHCAAEDGISSQGKLPRGWPSQTGSAHEKHSVGHRGNRPQHSGHDFPSAFPRAEWSSAIGRNPSASGQPCVPPALHRAPSGSPWQKVETGTSFRIAWPMLERLPADCPHSTLVNARGDIVDLNSSAPS